MSGVKSVIGSGVPAVQGDLLGEREAPAPARRRRGQRGPGRNTQMTRAWILARWDNPLEGMVALALPADALQIAEKARALASTFRCTVKEAVELMMKASSASMPFLNSQMPQDVNVNQRTVTLAIGMGSAPAPGERSGGLGELRQLMIDRAKGATPEGREVLEGVARDLEQEDDDNSST